VGVKVDANDKRKLNVYERKECKRMKQKRKEQR